MLVHKKLAVRVAFVAALAFSESLIAQSVGGVIKGTSVQQTQSQLGNSQPINQNGRLLLELQSMREELAALRNQVEQQGFQLRQLQGGQTGASVNASGYNTGSSSGYNASSAPVGELPGSQSQQQYAPANTPSAQASNQIVQPSSVPANGVQFPLLPQDQSSLQAGQVQQQAQQSANPQAVPQLVPQQSGQSSQQFVQQGSQLVRSSGQNQPVQSANQQLSPQGKLLEEGDRGIKTNLKELELYNKGIDKLTAQDYKSAASIFSSQLQNFPRGEKAGDGYFWLAETFYILEDLDSSAKSYQSLIDLFPRHVRTPKALFKLVGVHQERSDSISAKIAMNVLVKKYPNSEESSLAKSQYSALL